MTLGTQKVIEEHIDWIENNEFTKIYELHDVFDRSEFTQIMLSIGIDPLNYMTYIPENYLYDSDIKSFNIPQGIERIGMGAFGECSNLSKVTIPEGVTHILQEAFVECHNLENINFPSSIQYLKEGAFAETGLKHVVLPDHVQLSRYVFEECKQLETIKFGNGITRIRPGCFAKCESLRSVMLNSDLERIGEHAFKECYSLTEIYIPESVTSIKPSSFYGIENDITIICTENSTAHEYALLNGMSFKLI